ncbi:hypothetical protein MKX07_004028 [Trichoderma sp. CBMAI-0711]|nr:hypothetical protein MKX07_004028 [Trichoderma sp. CBMAI-0711]
MRLLSSLYLLSLAIAPVFATADGKARSKSGSKIFDVKSLSLREVGARNTVDWRVWLELDGDPISFWHDIPLYPDEKQHNIVNFYVEIPRWTDAKIETKRDKPLNPIYHDDKDDEPRYVASIWPHKSYPFLYGSLPQTWENPNIKHNFTGYVGDNDPMDVVDISAIDPGYVGQVRTVKILGAIPMIDPDANESAIDDLEKYRPGLKQTFYDWFTVPRHLPQRQRYTADKQRPQYYKVLRSGNLNTIFLDKYQDSTTARDIVAESHGFWKDLISGKEVPGKISIAQTSQADVVESYVKSKDATKKFDLPKKSDIKTPKERPAKYDKWFYLDDNFEPLPEQEIDVD